MHSLASSNTQYLLNIWLSLSRRKLSKQILDQYLYDQQVDCNIKSPYIIVVSISSSVIIFFIIKYSTTTTAIRFMGDDALIS